MSEDPADRFYYHFGQRPFTVSHSAFIPDGRGHDERDYDQQVAAVFKVQVPVYRKPGGKESPHLQLARHFYEQCFKAPRLSVGIDGAPVDVDEFIAKVLVEQPPAERNSFFYLLGDVGVGKSAYIYWLITTRIREYVQKGTMWFLNIDLEDYRRDWPSWNDQPTDSATWPVNWNTVARRLLQRFESLAERHPDVFAPCEKELDALRGLPNVTPAQVCAYVTNLRQTTSRHLVLVLDNLDFLCHTRDQALFADSSKAPDKPILVGIHDFLSGFLPAGPFGHLGANVLVVTRQDSYEILREVSRVSHATPKLTEENRAYSMRRPEASVVLEARCDLLRFAAQVLPMPEGTRKKYKALPEQLMADLSAGQPKLIEHLTNIKNSSYREVVEFFARYGWMTEPRLIASYRLGLMAAILGHHCRFSEAKCHFPNIYLTRPRPDGNSRTGTNNPTTPARPHSYWVKRLILEMLRETDVLGPEQILGVFCSGSRAYPEPMVRDCLGDLSDGLGAACIRVWRTSHPNHHPETLAIERVALTERARHCLDSVFDRFYYLQLVVEDADLPIPVSALGSFRYDRMDRIPLNYAYVTQPVEAEYARLGAEMIRVKTEQVLLFVEILAQSLELERDLFADAFEALSRRSVGLPDMTQLRASIDSELQVVTNFFHGALDLPAVVGVVERQRQPIWQDLVRAYPELTGRALLNTPR